tara:strand:+ start:19 stop:375 length:357 start_codon:yes stop_codon:yes gene_type:complete
MAVTLSRFTVVGTADTTNITATGTAEAVTITIKDLSRTFVRMTNVSSTVTCITTISASDNPMVAEGIGDLTVTLAPDATTYWGAADSARYKSTAGTIVLTPDSTIGGVTFEVGELTPY